MSSMYKPENYSTVSPYLIVKGASGTIEFLINVFGAEELRRFPNDNGKVMHAEVRLDDTVLMIADAAEGWPAVPAHVHIYVPDVDVIYKRAIEADIEAAIAKIPICGQEIASSPITAPRNDNNREKLNLRYI